MSNKPYAEREAAVTAAAASFAGQVFSVRAFPELEMRVSPDRYTHFWSDGVWLVLESRRKGSTDRWQQFGRFEPTEIRREMISRG